MLIFATRIYPSCWQMTSSIGIQEATLRLQIIPDEDTRLECGNVGLCIHLLIKTRVAIENMTALLYIAPEHGCQ